MSLKRASTVIEPDINAVNDFQSSKYYNPYRSSILIDFDVQSDNTVNMGYFIATTQEINNEKDYCFDGLMYNREDGVFYLSPDEFHTHIPIIDAKEFVKTVVKVLFNTAINPAASVLDNYFQNLKLSRFDDYKKARHNGDLHELLDEVIKVSQGMSQRTAIGNLLYGESPNQLTPSGITRRPRIDPDLGIKFEETVARILFRIAKMISRILASITKPTDSGILNTTIGIHRTAYNVFYDTPLFDKVIAMTRIDSQTPELSTNLVFNPMAREVYDRLSQPGVTKSGYAKGSAMMESDAITIVLNAIDMSTDDRYLAFSAVFNGAYDPTDPSFQFDDVKVNNEFLARFAQVNKARNVYKTRSLNDAAFNSQLDKIDAANSEFNDVSTELLPDRLIKMMTKFFKEYST